MRQLQLPTRHCLFAFTTFLALSVAPSASTSSVVRSLATATVALHAGWPVGARPDPSLTSRRTVDVSQSVKINGVGGTEDISKKLATYGAHAVRTWHIEDLGASLADAAASSLKVSAGIWLTHNASRYKECDDMTKDEWWLQELERILQAIRWFKDASALLWWMIGNEIELEIDWASGNDCLWRRLEWVVAAVKTQDPSHQVGTVLAGFHPSKVANVKRLCPSLDFLGINAYGGASLKLGQSLSEHGWTKPYVLAEFGPRGHWSSAKTPWGARVEQTSTEKVTTYTRSYEACLGDANCLGSFAFLWGWKWEMTGTWYGMLNKWPAATRSQGEDCCETEVVATMEKLWSGNVRSNRPPSIDGIRVQGQQLQLGVSAQQGCTVLFEVIASDPDFDSLSATWILTREASVADKAEAPIDGVLRSCHGTALQVLMDTAGLNGTYRLYSFVRDGLMQEAHASVPINVCSSPPCGVFCRNTAQGEACFDNAQWVMKIGIREHPEWYDGLVETSSLAEVQSMLHESGSGECEQPCANDVRVTDLPGECHFASSSSVPSSVRTSQTTTTTTTVQSSTDGPVTPACHTAVAGEACYAALWWAVNIGILSNPEWYPGLIVSSSLVDFQVMLNGGGHGGCPVPCPATTLTTTTTITTTTSTTITTTRTGEPPATGTTTRSITTTTTFISTTAAATSTRTTLAAATRTTTTSRSTTTTTSGSTSSTTRTTTIPATTTMTTTSTTTTTTSATSVTTTPTTTITTAATAMTATTATSTTTICHTAVEGEICYSAVSWAMNVGITSNPHWYPGLTNFSSSFDFQRALHRGGHGDCVSPCATATPTTTRSSSTPPTSATVTTGFSAATTTTSVSSTMATTSSKTTVATKSTRDDLLPSTLTITTTTLRASTSTSEIQAPTPTLDTTTSSGHRQLTSTNAALKVKTCHTAVAGDECHDVLLLELGIESRSLWRELESRLLWKLVDVQLILHNDGRGNCPLPCAAPVATTMDLPCAALPCADPKTTITPFEKIDLAAASQFAGGPLGLGEEGANSALRVALPVVTLALITLLTSRSTREA